MSFDTASQLLAMGVFDTIPDTYHQQNIKPRKKKSAPIHATHWENLNDFRRSCGLQPMNRPWGAMPKNWNPEKSNI